MNFSVKSSKKNELNDMLKSIGMPILKLFKWLGSVVMNWRSLFRLKIVGVVYPEFSEFYQ